jgi:predicted GNAT family acetyltransferase
MATEEQAQPPVVHNAAAKRFEVVVDGQTAYSKYLLAGNKMVIEHTEVPVGLEGRGIAGRIVRTELEYARAHKLVVLALCPYAKAFIGRHPEYQDLLDR